MKFPAIHLSADDLLPTDIVMLLVYRTPAAGVAESLDAGLRVFPHLTGKLAGGPPRIVPAGDEAFAMETEESTEDPAVEDFERMADETMCARFVPAAREGGLFAVRRVDFPRTGLMALGLRVSHMAVDGTGLGWFLAHATAGARGVAAPPVVHDRAAMRVADGVCGEIPEGHVARKPEGAPAVGRPLWFAVPMAAAGQRNAFAAWLCGEIARIDPMIRRVAVWCNTRGRGGPPPTYTGNAGCYRHVDIAGDDAELALGIHALATRSGLARARRMHQEILRLRAAGREVWWDGPRADVLELNLLAPPVEVADFGSGSPAFALLLSRNSNGLRVFPGVCGRRFVVEATLPPGMAAALVEACAKRGLAPEVWGGGVG